MSMTRILIADDHAMIRKGIATVLTHELDGHDVVCDKAVCGSEAFGSAHRGHAITGTVAPEPASHASLSNREFQVMKRLAAGQIPKCVAGDLDISIKTVSTYKKRIFEKMRFSSDADLVVYAMKNGFLD